MRVASRISIAYLFLFVPIINQLAIANSDNYCDFLPETAQPAWVAGENRLPGYYVGVGESDTRRGSAEAQKMAKQRALADLSSSISTHVTQRLSIQINTGSGENSFQKNFEERTKTITQNSIKNSTRDAIWLDRQSCRLWMRVKVSEKEVEVIQDKNFNQMRLDLAGQLYQTATNPSQPQLTRLEKIEDALRQIKNIDFTALPLESRESYLKKYRKLQTHILSQSGSNEVIVVTLSDQSLSKAVHKELAYRISSGLKNSKHIYPAPCENRESCLGYARSMYAKRLILVSVKTTKSTGDMGSTLGILKMDSALYDIASGRQLAQFLNQQGQALSFDPDNIAWTQAIERLFDKNVVITQLKKTAQQCSVQQC